MNYKGYTKSEIAEMVVELNSANLDPAYAPWYERTIKSFNIVESFYNAVHNKDENGISEFIASCPAMWQDEDIQTDNMLHALMDIALNKYDDKTLAEKLLETLSEDVFKWDSEQYYYEHHQIPNYVKRMFREWDEEYED